MRICDICKTNQAIYTDTATIDNNGTSQKLELCRKCYDELIHRENLHRHQAYKETVQAMTGQIPRKFHWWNRFSW